MQGQTARDELVEIADQDEPIQYRDAEQGDKADRGRHREIFSRHPEGEHAADKREAAMAKRLDRLSRQFEKLERDQNILIETVALYVRYYLTVSTPLPESHQEAARAQGRARFEQFVEQLGRHILRGRSLVREVYEELEPDTRRLDEIVAQVEAQEREQQQQHDGVDES